MMAGLSQTSWHLEAMFGLVAPKKPLIQAVPRGGQHGTWSILELLWQHQMLLELQR